MKKRKCSSLSYIYTASGSSTFVHWGSDTDSQTFSNSLIIHGVTNKLNCDVTVIILIINSRNDPHTCWTIQAIVSYVYLKLSCDFNEWYFSVSHMRQLLKLSSKCKDHFFNTSLKPQFTNISFNVNNHNHNHSHTKPLSRHFYRLIYF